MEPDVEFTHTAPTLGGFVSTAGSESLTTGTSYCEVLTNTTADPVSVIAASALLLSLTVRVRVVPDAV
jgi:hypothetical protein